jgi:frataxin-like iron-binding protein CyaY
VKRHAGEGEADFDQLARATLAEIATRAAALRRGIVLNQTPSVLVIEVSGKARLGLSEQKSSREIWCSSSLGELRFRYIPSSKRWRAADGEELMSTVREFLSRSLGESIQFEHQ